MPINPFNDIHMKFYFLSMIILLQALGAILLINSDHFIVSFVAVLSYVGSFYYASLIKFDPWKR